jgi:hypothetical protein
MALFRWKRRHPLPGFCDRQKPSALLLGAELALAIEQEFGGY